MTTEQIQNILIQIFTISLIGCCLLAFFSVHKEYIYLEDATKLLTHFLILYSVPYATIVAGILGKKKKGAVPIPPGHVKSLAIGMAILWNVLVIIPMALFIMRNIELFDDVIKHYKDIMPSTTFLLAGALTYFFANEKT